MKWKESYATDIEKIDTQHKMLFSMLHDFSEALDEGKGNRTYGLFLEFLGKFCSAHFRAEEECMKVRKCPMAEKNLKEHAAFAKRYEDYQQRYSVKGFCSVEARELVELIQKWIGSHICRIDLSLKGFSEPDLAESN